MGFRYDFSPRFVNQDNMGFLTRTSPIPSLATRARLIRRNRRQHMQLPTVNNYYKNFGPRLGIAYQSDPKTVLRASYGVMYTHGNGLAVARHTAGGAGNTWASPQARKPANLNLVTTFPDHR